MEIPKGQAFQLWQSPFYLILLNNKDLCKHGRVVQEWDLNGDDVNDCDWGEVLQSDMRLGVWRIYDEQCFFKERNAYVSESIECFNIVMLLTSNIHQRITCHIIYQCRICNFIFILTSISQSIAPLLYTAVYSMKCSIWGTAGSVY